jgi:hypothetical protein
MTDLRKLARGQLCMVRVPLVCIGDPLTTVLAHVRLIGVSGMSVKAPDWFAAWACSACHDYVDGRTPTMDSYDTRRLLLLEGMVRTQYELLSRGVLPQ